jgi:hypothetical protein
MCNVPERAVIDHGHQVLNQFPPSERRDDHLVLDPDKVGVHGEECLPARR